MRSDTVVVGSVHCSTALAPGVMYLKMGDPIVMPTRQRHFRAHCPEPSRMGVRATVAVRVPELPRCLITLIPQAAGETAKAGVGRPEMPTHRLRGVVGAGVVVIVTARLPTWVPCRGI